MSSNDEFDQIINKPIENNSDESNAEFDAIIAKGQPKPDTGAGLIGDALLGVGEGVLRTPSTLAGVADIVPGLMGYDAPVDKALTSMGEATGFQPEKWADETKYSEKLELQKQNLDKVWDDPNKSGLDVAKEYITNPALIADIAAKSAAPMVTGGVAGKLLSKAGVAGAAYLGEGAVMAGDTMSQLDDSVSPQQKALTSLAIGGLGAGIGKVGGKVAEKAGVLDPEKLLAQGYTREQIQQVQNKLLQRVGTGAGIEAGEEVLQSTAETGLQNLAEGKDFTEGLSRNIVEGGLVGGAMGAGANIAKPKGALSRAVEGNVPEPKVDQKGLPDLPKDEVITFEDGTQARASEIYETVLNETGNEEQARKTVDQIVSKKPVDKEIKESILPNFEEVNTAIEQNKVDKRIVEAVVENKQRETDKKKEEDESVSREQVYNLVSQDLEKGGGISVDKDGKRSSSVNAEWFKDGNFTVKSVVDENKTITPTYEEVVRASELNRDNKPLTRKQQNIVEGLKEEITSQENESKKSSLREENTNRILVEEGVKGLIKDSKGTKIERVVKDAIDKGSIVSNEDVKAWQDDIQYEKQQVKNDQRTENISQARPTEQGNKERIESVDSVSGKADRGIEPTKSEDIDTGITDGDKIKREEKLSETKPKIQNEQSKQAKTAKKNEETEKETTGSVDPILSKSKTDYINEQLKSQQIKKTSPGFKDAKKKKNGKETIYEDAKLPSYIYGKGEEQKKLLNVHTATNESKKILPIREKSIDGQNIETTQHELNKLTVSINNINGRLIKGGKASASVSSVDLLKDWTRKVQLENSLKKWEKSHIEEANNFNNNESKVRKLNKGDKVLLPNFGRKESQPEYISGIIKKKNPKNWIIRTSNNVDLTLQPNVLKPVSDDGYIIESKKYSKNDLKDITNAVQLAEYLENNSEDKLISEIAKSIKSMLNTETYFHLSNTSGSYGKVLIKGTYSDKEGKDLIIINLEGQNDSTILHELIHAATAKKIRDEKNNQENKKLISLFKDINDISLYLKKNTDNFDLSKDEKNSIRTGTVNVDEFLTHTLTNIHFQSALKKIDSPEKKRKNIFETMSAIIKDILKLDNISNKIFSSAIDLSFTTIDTIKSTQTKPTKENKDVKRSLDTIKGIDSGEVIGSTRALFVGSIVGKVKTLYKNGKFDEVDSILNQIKTAQKGLNKPLISSANKIWKLGSGDVKFSKQEQQTTSKTTDSEIKGWLTKKQKNMVDAGKLNIVKSWKDLPVELRERGKALSSSDVNNLSGVKGLYDPKTDSTYLIQNMLDENNINQVLNHELYHRALVTDKKLKQNRDKLDTRLQQRYDLASKGKGTQVEKDAYARVMDAETKQSDQLEEFQAYLVTAYNTKPESFTGSIKKWVQDLIASIKAVLIRQGVLPKNITPADLNALAQYGTKVDNKIEKVDKDSLLASIKPSGDLLSSQFKRWFGKSKMKSGGKPIKFYHGTNADFTVFDKKKLAQPKEGQPVIQSTASLGHFFVADRSIADSYGSSTHEVYLSIENPYVVTSDMLDSNMGDDGAKFAEKLKGQGYDGIYVKDAKYAIAFDSNQIKLTSNENPTFSDDIRFSKSAKKGSNRTWKNKKGFEGLSDKTFDALAKTGHGERDSFSNKMKDGLEKHKYLWRNRLRQKGVDQYDSLKSILNNKEAWMMANMTNTGGAVAEGALKHGRPFLDKSGAIDNDVTKKSLGEIVNPLGNELDRFMMWMAGNRAEGLKVDGKENLFSDEDIVELKALNKNENGTEWKEREATYNEVTIEFEQMHNSIVKIGVDTGLISKEDAKLWKQQGFYVPFYRIAEDSADNHGVSSIGGLVKQDAYKKLKGADMQLDDLLTNTLMNWTHITGAALKNQAASKALESAAKMNVIGKEGVKLATKIPKALKGKNSVFVRVDGQEQWYNIDDSPEGQLVLESLTSLNYDGLNTPSMKIMRKFKRALTIGVTASPEFKIANLMRDSIQAIAVSGMSTNIAKNLTQGYKATEKGKETTARMVTGGGAFGDSGYIHGGDPDATKRIIEKDIGKETILDTRGKFMKVWDKYQDFGSRLENINRAANFEQDLAKGKSLLEANFNARDHLDFARTGSATSVRAIAQVVPFLNARLQGLDKLGRAAMDKDQRGQFAAVVGTYSIASVLLYLSMKDDEDYKEAEQWERDTYHLFKLPGSDKMYRIPRPFEVGAMANMAERFTEQLVDDEVHGELFAERLIHTLFQTFAMNPTPQMFKPVMETWANKSTFTGRAIESQSMQRLSKTERKKAWTSQTAVGASKAMDAVLWDDVVLSPVQVDHLIKGYLGWLGASSLNVVDFMARPALGVADKPTSRIEDTPVIGRFVREGKGRSSKYITDFYENQREITQHYYDIKRYRDNQEFDKAKEAFDEHKDQMYIRKHYNRVSRRLSELNKKIRLAHSNKKMSPERKRIVIDRANNERIKITKKAVKAFKK